MPDATERKVLIWCTTISAVLSFPPQGFTSVSGYVLLAVAVLMIVANGRITSREQALLSLLEQWAPAPREPSDPPSEDAPPAPEEA